MAKADEDEEGKHPALDAAAGSALRSAAGSCLYLAGDRWDIQRDLQLVTRKLQAPTDLEWKRMVRIGRYLQGTRTFGSLVEAGPRREGERIKVMSYSDTDHAGCSESRRSTSADFNH